MRCRKVNDLLIPYLDKELSGDAVLRLEKHLQTCVSCRVRLSEYRKLDTMLKVGETIEMPDWMRERIRHQVRMHDPQRRAFRRRWNLQTVPITLALLLSIYIGTLIGIKTFTVAATEPAGDPEIIAYGETTIFDLAYTNGENHE